MTSRPKIERPWWEPAVLYQVYPRSYQDSNGDRVGDLRGITDRLDHLAWLGVDALWLSPIFPSPMADFGDVLAYERSVTGRRLVVLLNLGDRPARIEVDGLGGGRVLLSTGRDRDSATLSGSPVLAPGEGLIVEPPSPS